MRFDAVRLADGFIVNAEDPFAFTLATWARMESVPYDVYRALSGELKQLTFSTALKLRPQAMEDLRKLIESGIRFGTPIRELLDRADGIFSAYGGVAGVPAHRLELVFRQNEINTMNAGRYAFQFGEEGMAQAPMWRFNAIRDRRTDDVCMRLNGMIFAKDDVRAREFLPPVHFNCRCFSTDVVGDAIAVSGHSVYDRGLSPDDGFAISKVPYWVHGMRRAA